MNTTVAALLGAFGALAITVARRVDQANNVAPPQWQIPEKGLPFAAHFIAAEDMYNLPRNLLARIALQESNFEPNARSHAGAEGIMQIMRRWHPTVNPLDPVASIYYAGKYMRELLDRFNGDMQKALAAYNWGPTNVSKKGVENAPGETRKYVADIGGDLGIAAPIGGLV